jgi:hypothetical protein
VNHTRFPKEDHLPDWALRDNKVTKFDCVECLTPCWRDELHRIKKCSNKDVCFLLLCHSFDVRGRQFGQAKLWSSPAAFGARAYFRTASTPAQLLVDDVALTDEGMYRCRVDFRNTPTRNLKINLTVIGKFVSFVGLTNIFFFHWGFVAFVFDSKLLK